MVIISKKNYYHMWPIFSANNSRWVFACIVLFFSFLLLFFVFVFVFVVFYTLAWKKPTWPDLYLQFYWRRVNISLISWNINCCWLFNAKSCFYIYIKYMICKYIIQVHRVKWSHSSISNNSIKHKSKLSGSKYC